MRPVRAHTAPALTIHADGVELHLEQGHLFSLFFGHFCKVPQFSLNLVPHKQRKQCVCLYICNLQTRSNLEVPLEPEEQNAEQAMSSACWDSTASAIENALNPAGRTRLYLPLYLWPVINPARSKLHALSIKDKIIRLTPVPRAFPGRYLMSGTCAVSIHTLFPDLPSHLDCISLLAVHPGRTETGIGRRGHASYPVNSLKVLVCGNHQEALCSCAHLQPSHGSSPGPTPRPCTPGTAGLCTPRDLAGSAWGIPPGL